jgi:hypothetical protein
MAELQQEIESEGLDDLANFVGIYALPPTALLNPRDITSKTQLVDPFQNFPFPVKAVVVQPLNFDRPYKNAIPTFIYPHSNSCKRTMCQPTTHSFVLTDPSGQRLFCSCLRVYTPVTDVELACIKMRNLQFLQDENGLLDFDGGHSPVVGEAYKPRALAVVSKFRFHYVLNRFLRAFEDELIQAKDDTMLDELCRKVYISLKHPMGPGVGLMLGVGNEHYLFQQPRRDELPDYHINPNILFGLLEPLNVILLLTALLTETSVLIVSDDIENLTHVTETLLMLLWPMEWVYVYIPIMPNLESLIVFFDSPQPYLIGASTELYKTLHLEDDNVVIANLDTNEITGAEEFTQENCPKAFPWQLNWRLYRAIRDHLPIFNFFHPSEELRKIPNLPPHADVEEYPKYKNTEVEKEERSQRGWSLSFLSNSSSNRKKITEAHDSKRSRGAPKYTKRSGFGRLISWHLPSPKLNYADMRTLSPDSDSSDDEVSGPRRLSIMNLLKGPNVRCPSLGCRHSHNFLKTPLPGSTESNKSANVKVGLLWHSDPNGLMTSNTLSPLDARLTDGNESWLNPWPSLSVSTDRINGTRAFSSFRGNSSYSSFHVVQKTPLSWSLPKSPRLELEDHKEHICPVVSLYKFQRTCVSVMQTICKGYPLFLKIPQVNDLVRLRTFRFFDKDKFLKARKEHACLEPYEKALIPFLGPFVRSQFFSVFIQERIMKQHDDYFDIEVKRKSTRRHNRERILRGYSHYGFLWKQGRKTPNWRYRIFELHKNVLSYWEPNKETSTLVTKYTKALKTSRLKKRDDFKDRLRQVLYKAEKLGFVILNSLTEIDIPQSSARSFPTTYKVPTDMSFEIVIPEPTPRRLRCCTEEKSSRQLWLDLIKTRTRSSLNRVVERIIDPQIRYAMLENHNKKKKIESLMDPTATVICDVPHPSAPKRILVLPNMNRERSITSLKSKSIPTKNRTSRLVSPVIKERRPDSLPDCKVPRLMANPRKDYIIRTKRSDVI